MPIPDPPPGSADTFSADALLRLAVVALGGRSEAEKWFDAPHLMLGFVAPRIVARDHAGARRVERLLLDIRSSLPAGPSPRPENSPKA